MNDTWREQLPAVAHVPEGEILLKRKIEFGMSDGSFKLTPSNQLKSVVFDRSGPGSLVTSVASPPGFPPFFTPETHVAPLDIFLPAPGMSNDRSFAFRAMAQNTVLMTNKSTVTGLLIMARRGADPPQDP